jgi:hypothetical protein
MKDILKNIGALLVLIPVFVIGLSISMMVLSMSVECVTGRDILREYIRPLFVTKTSYKRVGIIHDYVFTNAENICKTHNGLHYVVQVTDIEEVGSDKNYPCSEKTQFRCQDGTLHTFETGVGYCFISEMQLDDTLNNKDVSEEYK